MAMPSSSAPTKFDLASNIAAELLIGGRGGWDINGLAKATKESLQGVQVGIEILKQKLEKAEGEVAELKASITK